MLSAKTVILAYMKENDIKKAWLARKLDILPQYLGSKLKAKDLDTKTIAQIGAVLRHNFFEDLSRAYDAEQKGLVPIEQIVNEPEVKYLAAEALLRKVVREELKDILNK